MPAGRPPIFENSQELIDAIDDYFKNGVKLRQVVVGKAPKQQVLNIPVPTITGLCYHIGFESRQSFYDYEEKPEFSYTVKRARLFIEKEYEEQLSIGNTVGAIFALKNMGWKDKTETEFSGKFNIEHITGMKIYDSSKDKDPILPPEESRPGIQ